MKGAILIMGFIDTLKERAKANVKTIVLPETEDMRTIEAAATVLKEGTANLVLIGNKEEVLSKAGDLDLSGASFVNPATSDKLDSYVETLVELRKNKGMTEETDRKLLTEDY